MIDFIKEAQSKKEELIKDLETLCQIDSVLDLDTAKENRPFGKGPREALDAMISIGKRDGFETDEVDGYAGHIDIGEGDRTLGILGHLDVVPVNPEGWHYPPFGATLDGDRLYGRGVADDKGPLLAAYYGAKIVNDMDFEKKMKIRVIFGCNEETGSACVKHYFKHRPYPDEGFTPDAEFPVTFGEKSICRINYKTDMAMNDLKSFKAGTVVNIVPDHAEAVLAKDSVKEDDFRSFLDAYKLKGSYKEDTDTVTLSVEGQSAHGSLPEIGTNAASYLGHFIHSVVSHPLTDFIDQYFFEDVHGEKLGIAYEGVMGKGSVNLGIVKYDGKNVEVVLDLRWPHEVSEEELTSKLDEAGKGYNFAMTYEWTNALYVDPKSELITKLHNAYVDITGDHEHQPQSMGGGTYAKEMPNCVAFGAEYPNRDNRMHQNDEYMVVDELIESMAIYAKAIYNLVK